MMVIAAIVLFIAHNLQNIGCFVKLYSLQLLIVTAVTCYIFLPSDSAIAKGSLFAASILVGVLLRFLDRFIKPAQIPMSSFYSGPLRLFRGLAQVVYRPYGRLCLFC